MDQGVRGLGLTSCRPILGGAISRSDAGVLLCCCAVLEWAEISNRRWW